MFYVRQTSFDIHKYIIYSVFTNFMKPQTHVYNLIKLQ